MATALCALGTTSAFTGPLAGGFRAVSEGSIISRPEPSASVHSYYSLTHARVVNTAVNNSGVMSQEGILLPSSAARPVIGLV